jgi:hypothetical protein
VARPTAVKLKPVVRYREFPFGTADDPSMREFMATTPRDNQDRVVEYLRSGHVLAVPMGADLPDWFDRPNRANPLIGGRLVGGATPMTDGVWVWPAGLIHFIEKYNVSVPAEFVEHAARSGWRVDGATAKSGDYDYEY